MDTLLYLAGKDDDLLDDSISLVLEGLLNDVATNFTCPSDGKDRVSRHELNWNPAGGYFGPETRPASFALSFYVISRN